MKKFFFCLLLFVGLSGYAQQAEVKGMVMDGEDQKQPLAFAEVKVKGSTLNAITDLDGKFSMHLFPGTYTFVVQFIGYQPIEITGMELTGQGIVLDPVVLRTKKVAAGLVASSEE